jgi:hypothetical protein
MIIPILASQGTEQLNNSTLRILGGRAVNRLLKAAAFVVVALYFTVDAAFSYVTKPLVSWIGKIRLFEKLRAWIVSLKPYPALALFAVPVIILEPVKPAAAYLMGTGHFALGLGCLAGGEILKLTFVERLFQLNRKKLLSIPAFAWAYKQWRRVMDWVEAMEVWQAARRFSASTLQHLRDLVGQLKPSQRSLRFLWQTRP